MVVIIPLYIEITRAKDANAVPSASAQPLFFAAPIVRAQSVERALGNLQNELQQKLLALSRAPDHDGLLPWLDLPNYQSHRLKLRVHDGERERVGDFIWISYRALDRLLLFTPKLPHAHIEIDSLEHMTERLPLVMSQWLKQARKSSTTQAQENFTQAGNYIEFDDLAIPDDCQVRLSLLELDINPTQASVKAGKLDLAGMGGADRQPDGAAELSKVGRQLNANYLEGMPRGIGIQNEALRLMQAWLSPKREAQLLLGASGVGKTMVIFEAIRLMKLAADAKLQPRIWLISPQRLISGMSYLGEWEARLLAILKYAEQRNLILYFDDVLALFSAGKHSGSDLTVGDLLLPWLEKRQVHALAEMTPETWRVLRERRRDFADLWQVQPVHPLPDAKRWAVLAALTRELSMAHDIQFDLHAVPCAVELCTRYAGEREFPGNVADQLRRLAARAPAKARITRDDVTQDFSQRLGLSLDLLDARKTLLAADIEAQLRQYLKGQASAISALTNAVLRCKTGLNDPKRPLAVMLLLGPTGVGKTQCAKALAKLVSPNVDALIRIDLNEYSEFGDAARLVGTWAQPDGILTAAIRRQPTSVVLFDEIEKANPEVFDLLLSLLDEGRLTDAHGRVADFTRAFILMTSNLGAREAGVQLGFTALAHQQDFYQDAAKKFFRPEFFNRLDDVIGFRPFNASELREITTLLVQQALARAGIRARHCLVALESSAIAALAQIGQDPNLGARAIKRGIERALVQPLARYLSVLNVRQPLRITLTGVAESLSIALEEFAYAARTVADFRHIVSLDQLADVFDACTDLLAQFEIQLDAMSASGSIALGAISSKAQHYFACREQQSYVQRALERLTRAQTGKPLGRPHKLVHARASSARSEYAGAGARAKQGEALISQLSEIGSAEASAAQGFSSAGPTREALILQDNLRMLISAISWFAILLNANVELETRFLNFVRLPTPLGTDATAGGLLANMAEALKLLPGCQQTHLVAAPSDIGDSETSRSAALHIEGFALDALLQVAQGWTLSLPESGLQLSRLASRKEINAPDEDASAIIIRKQTTDGFVDLRSNLRLASQSKPNEYLDFWLAHLPLPAALNLALAATLERLSEPSP